MRLTRCVYRKVGQLLDYYSNFHPSVLSIQQFLDFGRSVEASEPKSFIFLRKELLVRLANIMKEIHLLPDELQCMPSVQLVESWYEQSFQDILHYHEKKDLKNLKTMESFTETLVTVRNRHMQVVETMAQGVIELKESSPEDNMKLENQIQYFLDRFYMSRISIRMLINQHTTLFGVGSHPQHIGCIDPYCEILSIAKDAYENARFLCEQYYMTAPDVVFTCINPYEKETGEKIVFNYVPSHLYHMLFELIKNSLRAVVEFHGEENPALPELRIMICKGKEDVTIKLSDEGGGIPKGQMDYLFHYMYSTAARPPSPQETSSTPLAGYGYGLPLSRLYAKYFNGDLNLTSVEGYGTDALIHLKVHPTDSLELLPVYNRTSETRYSSAVPVSDWSDASQTQGLHGAIHQIPTQQARSYSTALKEAHKSHALKEAHKSHAMVATDTAKTALFHNESKPSAIKISDCVRPGILGHRQYSTLSRSLVDRDIKPYHALAGMRMFSTLRLAV